MKKNMIAIFMVIIMFITMMPIIAFAENETTSSQPTTINETAKIITVSTAGELRWISDYSYKTNDTDKVKNIPFTFSGWKILIANDIDLNGEAWTPIKDFHGTMEGDVSDENSYRTIFNLNVTPEKVTDGAGLCGNISYSGATPKFSNIMISGARIETNGTHAGTFAADAYTSIFTNCHVKDSEVLGKRFIGGFAGTSYGNMTNCTIEKSKITLPTGKSVYVSSGDNAGAFVGLMGEGNMTISKCIADDVTITGSRQLGGIAGVAQYGNTITGCTVKNSTINATGIGNGISRNRSVATGGIVGQLQGGDSIITISSNTVGPSTTINRTGLGSTYNYCGWLIGDITRASNAFEENGNSFDGTTSLSKIGN